MQRLHDFAALMTDRRVSWASKLFFVIVVGAYIALPLDLIPDIFLPFGIVDDGGLVIAAIAMFMRHANGQIERQAIMSGTENKDIVTPDAENSIVTSDADNDSVVVWGGVNDYPKARKQQGIHSTPRGSRNNFGCFALLALLIVSPCVGIAIIILSGSTALSGMLSSVMNFFDPPPTANIVSSRTIVHSLQGLGQLVTVSSEVAKADIQVSVNEGFLNAGSYSAKHVAVGVIEAGIDIATTNKDHVSYDSTANTYTLRLPSPNITSCRIEHIDQYGGSLTILPADWDLLRQLAQHDAINQFAQDMIEGGILERAKEEAALRLGDFIGALTGSQAHIEYEASDGEAKLPPSCQPDPPSGWGKGEDGAWRRAD